jgi:hypothetical protein
MSEIVNDLKLTNLEISEESGIRLSSQNPTIKHTRDNNTASATLSLTTDGALSLTGTTVSVNGATTFTNSLSLSNALIGSVQAGLVGAVSPGTLSPVLTTTLVTTLNVNAQDKHVLLGNGTTGQIKIITATLFTATCETTLNFTTPVVTGQKVLFAALGDSVTVLYTTQGWVILNIIGATII